MFYAHTMQTFFPSSIAIRWWEKILDKSLYGMKLRTLYVWHPYGDRSNKFLWEDGWSEPPARVPILRSCLLMTTSDQWTAQHERQSRKVVISIPKTRNRSEEIIITFRKLKEKSLRHSFNTQESHYVQIFILFCSIVSWNFVKLACGIHCLIYYYQ